MRVGFAGTPEFAARALAAIVAAGFDVPLVLTQPDRPKGRGLQASASAVKRWAAGRGLVLFQPPTLRAAEALATVADVPLDVLVVAAYGLILPRTVLEWPRHGCINIHASRLPRWRGAAPIQRAIEAGDTASGITIMQMDEGLDTGPTIEFVDVTIAPRETAGSLHDRLAQVGAMAIVPVLERLARDGVVASVAQPVTGVTYARKVDRADAAIDWARTSSQIDCQIRAFDPVPGAMASFGGAGVKVWRAEPVARAHDAAGGTVLAVDKEGIDVACGAGALKLRELQPASGKRMSASAFAVGHGVTQGSRFGAPASL